MTSAALLVKFQQQPPLECVICPCDNVMLICPDYGGQQHRRLGNLKVFMATTDPQFYQLGARVWLKDAEKVWISASLTRDYDGSSALHVEIDETLESRVISIGSVSELPPLRNPDILVGENDLTSLSYLHEPAVLHNLFVRFVEKRCIYTYCGIVLVAINPYEELHIYGNDTIGMYRGKSMGDLDPHIYAVSEEAFAKMERDDKNQSIIVSGESGAGKTVSAKYAMRYFATVGGTSKTETQVEKKVLASSPIMEAMGNAKTTRNDNSSRFGKYIEIDFNKRFHMVGAVMRTYLLEKSRVVFQTSDERNYHIFYQMCAARSKQEVLAGLKLDKPDSFFYMRQGENPDIEGVDDRREFRSTLEALKLLGFADKDQRSLFQILAGILHLGNVDITSSGSDSSAVDPAANDSLRFMSELLEIDEGQIRQWLCHKKLVSGKETVTTKLTPADAMFGRDALAKCIYSVLFDWIVKQINKALKPSGGGENKFIGVLDIYGFETFETNSFEQFCINYANEKLQQQFNLHVFKLEQEEYLREGIEDWKMVDFSDNQPCIDLIEKKLGILDLLDEECRMPRGSDQSWADKLYERCQKWSDFSKPKFSRTAFLVRHFADEVEYECNGFLGKNRDTVMEEQLNVIRASKNRLLSHLFKEDKEKKAAVKANNSGTKQNKKTVGTQFGESLNLLMKCLNATTPHYVRCVKPNDDKAAFQFDSRRAVQQLRACGVLETVRISAAGYPSRWTYHDFHLRYKVLCHSKDLRKSGGDARAACRDIVAKLIRDDDKVRFGKTKLFFRAGQVAFMEKKRSDRLRDCGICIQRHVRGWLCRVKYARLLANVLTVQRCIRGFLVRRRVARIRKVVGLQARARGYLARKRHARLLGAKAEAGRNAKAVVIQKAVRNWILKRRFEAKLKQVVLAQCCIRRFLAKKRLQKLKVEAKSVDHQKKLNQGLENKIISLQHKLTAAEKSNKDLNQVHAKEMEALRKSEKEASLKRVTALEDQLAKLKVELDGERSEKMDLVNERQLEQSAFIKKEKKLTKEIASLRKSLESSKNAVNSEELEEEKVAQIHAEYEQERMAYQTLLKRHGALESRYDHLVDELRRERGEEPLERSMSVMSIDSDSFYGSQSEVLCDQKGFRGSGWHVNDNEMDLKQKLSRVWREKEALEKRLEEMEDGGGLRQTANALRLQEFEMENGRLHEDLGKLRLAVADDAGDNSQIRVIVDQFEHLQDELERRREECIQLRTVLANASVDEQSFSSLLSSRANGELSEEVEDLLVAFETQKSVITQLQRQLDEERQLARELETDMRCELERMTKICREQQHVISQTISASAPSNSIEACLQYEITRLTAENVELRDKMDNLNEAVKRLRRQLRSCVAKLKECGATVPDMTADMEAELNARNESNYMPVIRKKEAYFLGMFEYKVEQEQQVLKALIYDLKPKIAAQMLPGLPAYILFMMIRYTDHINNDESVRSLIQGAISCMKKVVKKKGMNDLEVMTLWLSNALRMLHNLKQYSGEKQFQSGSTAKQVEQSLRNFDLSEYQRVLSELAIWIYQGMTKLMEEEVQPILVPSILEHEGISCSDKPRPQQKSYSSSSNHSSMEAPTHIDPRLSLDKLLRMLTGFHSTLSRHGLDPEIISQVFRQLFYFLCAGSLNNLLLRKDMCHWSRGMQIRYNVAQLEQWARDRRVHDNDRSKVIDALAPIVQASQLLQARKTEADVQAICDLCSTLKVSQVVKLLNLYTPNDEFEERVTPAFMRKIQAKLQDRVHPPESDQQVSTLLMDTKFSYAVMFPFNPSTIQMEELEIPESYSNLNMLLKKV